MYRAQVTINEDNHTIPLKNGDCPRYYFEMINLLYYDNYL